MGRSRRRRVPVPALLAALLLSAVAGCGGAAPAAPPAAPKAAPQAAPNAAPAAAAPSQAPPAASSAASSTASSTASPTLTPVTIAIPVDSEAFSEIYVAHDLGLFKKHGLDVTIETMKMPTAIAALTKGSVALEAGVGSIIRASEEGLPVKTVYVALPHPDYLIIGGKGINSLSQLKGKSIAMKTPLEAITAVGQQWLATQGLPVGSYKYVSSASTPEEIALLGKGTVQAAVLELSTGLPLTTKGFKLLGNTSSITIPLSGLATGDSTLQQHPAVLRGAIAASLEAVGIIRSDEARVLPVMEKNLHLKPALAKQVYNVIKDQYSLTGRPSAATIQRGFAMDRAALTFAHVKFTYPFKQSQIYDFSFLPAASK